MIIKSLVDKLVLKFRFFFVYESGKRKNLVEKINILKKKKISSKQFGYDFAFFVVFFGK